MTDAATTLLVHATDPAASPELMLCIASKQSLPNVLPLRVRPWQRLIVYASCDMSDEAQRLADVAEVLGEQRGLPGRDCCEVVALPEDLSYRTLAAFAAQEVQRLALAHPALRLAFNATGGLKTMTLAFARAMQGRGEVFYCQTERDCIERIEPEGPDQALPPALLDLDTYLAVQGWFVTRRVPLENAQALAGVWRRARLTSTLVRRVGELRHSFAATPPGFPPGAPRTVLGALHAAANQACEARKPRPRPFTPRQQLHVPGESGWWTVLLDEAVRCGVLAGWLRDGAVIDLEFASNDAAVYVAGGYLEEYVHLAVHALGLPGGAAARGVGIDRLARGEGRRSEEFNELDIAITWRNRLLILECKAGRQLFEPDQSQGILNKLGTLRTQVGGALGQAWILSNGKLDADRHGDILARAQALDVKVFDGPKLRNLPALLAQALNLPEPAPDMPWIDAPLRLKTGTA